MDDLTLANLRKQARVAAATGDAQRARQLYQRVLQQTPDDVGVIMDLLPLITDAEERQQYLQRVLRLQPYHEEASAALEMLTTTETTAKPTVEVLYCTNHPRRQTRLRCNKCGRPICTECAVRTPVGLRCKACVRQQQDKFYTATAADQMKGFVVALVGGILIGALIFLLSRILGVFGFLSLLAAFFAGPALGGAVAELIRRSMQRRRARRFHLWVSLLVAIVATPISLFAGNILVAGLALFMAISTLYTRLKT